MGVILYVGADAQNVQRRRLSLTGRRCFTAALGPHSRFTPEEVSQVVGLLDSGAFSDAPEDRLTADEALQRQLRWEKKAARFWKATWMAEALVSYDLLIDEKWVGGVRRKERWDVREADRAVRVTVDAAAYLASQRERLAPRKLVLSCQGVDGIQYQEAVEGVLRVAQPSDWIGLGGWCILGRQTSWMPTFWSAMRKCLPLVRAANVGRVHIFGVMYRPALGGLLWLCDELGLEVSTDSTSPVLAVTWPDKVKAGACKETWEENVAHHKAALANLRQSEHYREPPRPHGARQIMLF